MLLASSSSAAPPAGALGQGNELNGEDLDLRRSVPEDLRRGADGVVVSEYLLPQRPALLVKLHAQQRPVRVGRDVSRPVMSVHHGNASFPIGSFGFIGPYFHGG